jgi:hypothetical protein
MDPFPAGAAPGEACGEASPCANLLCLPAAVCATPCLDVQDCPTGFICDYLEVYRLDGGRSTVLLCVPDPGSMLSCQREADCLAGETCGVVLNPWGTGLDGRCQPAGSGGGPGTLCSSGQDCANGFCPLSGECASLCASDGDCPTDFGCVTLRVELWPGASFPVAGCLKVVRGDLGDLCPGGATDCVSGVCFHPQIGDSYCSLECLADTDCAAAADMTCVDDGGAVKYCQRPAG